MIDWTKPRAYLSGAEKMRAMRDREMIEAQMRYNEWASRRWQLPDPPA